MKLLLFIFSALILGCNPNHKQPGAGQKRLSPISQWLVDNEGSLFHSLSEWVKIDTLKNKAEGEILTREYLIDEGIFADLNEQIHKIGDCINVIYLLKPKATPHFDIFLTGNFDTACVGSIDTVFFGC